MEWKEKRREEKEEKVTARSVTSVGEKERGRERGRGMKRRRRRRRRLRKGDRKESKDKQGYMEGKKV